MLSKAEMDRLFQAMSDPSYAAALELRITASVGHRTWRQSWRSRFDGIDSVRLLADRHLMVANLLEANPPDPVEIAGQPQATIATATPAWVGLMQEMAHAGAPVKSFHAVGH